MTIELKVCVFIAENALPISMSENLVSLLKSLFPRDLNLKSVKLGKQKTTNIIRQVFGFQYVNMVKNLRNNMFSIIIDEATDRSSKKQLAILATCFDVDDFKTEYFLLDMVECSNSSARCIYSTIKQAFNEHDIAMENIIGYSSNITNVIFGKNNSLVKLQTSEFPNVIAVKCSCHLIYLASSYAATKLPKSLEDLCRDIFAHFSRSAKRQYDYKNFQNFFELEPHKMLAPSQTRWLSLEACVHRMLNQFDAIKHYFLVVATEDPTYSNERVSSSLNNMFTEAYLEFLSYQFNRINSFNRLYQSEKPVLYLLKDQAEELIRRIAEDFMEIAYVKDIKNAYDIDPTDNSRYVPLKNVYLGMTATTTSKEIEGARPTDVTKFYTDCRNFLIEMIIQIKEIFDVTSEIYTVVQCLNPKKAAVLNPSSISGIIKSTFLTKNLNKNLLELEWSCSCRAHTRRN